MPPPRAAGGACPSSPPSHRHRQYSPIRNLEKDNFPNNASIRVILTNGKIPRCSLAKQLPWKSAKQFFCCWPTMLRKAELATPTLPPLFFWKWHRLKRQASEWSDRNNARNTILKMHRIVLVRTIYGEKTLSYYTRLWLLAKSEAEDTTQTSAYTLRFKAKITSDMRMYKYVQVRMN